MSPARGTGEKQPVALTIAGSDPSGGAGIQADLKTFTALGCYGMAAVTAITVQNTRGVTGFQALDATLVAQQADAALADIPAGAVKTGMLANAEVVAAVAEVLRAHGARLVLDPVMVAKSGDALLAPDAVDALRDRLLPLAEVVTPNAPEAEVLSGLPVAGEDDILSAAEAIHALGARHVLIKGGHLAGDVVVDYLYDGKTVVPFSGRRVDTRHTHGTGCTFASAVCAYLARGAGVEGAVHYARRYVQGAIENAPGLGGGHGPLAHTWNLREVE